jgi:hypothetical protein
MCAIVKDKETGDSKGTAFLKYSRPQEAQACVAASLGLVGGAEALANAAPEESAVAPGNGKLMIKDRVCMYAPPASLSPTPSSLISDSSPL